MGVPGFFASLYSKYSNKKFVFSKNDPNINEFLFDINSIDELFLDANCLIHPICFKIFNENQFLLISNPKKLEEKMIKAVIIYIEELINYVNPSGLIYIAIDGVAPMAKIKHQRMRRFKSIADSEAKETIAVKHNMEYIKPWNNSAITPGTEFMAKITTSIINYLNIKKNKNLNNPNKINYIFSTANTPGEGEHKILQYIKSNLSSNKCRIIYGLDADLLYLALASGGNRIYLLREITEFQNMQSSDKFCYVSIDIMRDCIYDTVIENIKDVYEKSFDEYKMRFIQDYIFMGFLLGNDFLPSLPSVNLMIGKKNLSGLEINLRAYKEAFMEINSFNCDTYQFILQIEPKIKINYNFIKILFKYLSAEEESYFRARYKNRRYIKPCEKNDAYNLEIHHLENMMFKIPDLFELGKEGIPISVSKNKYYKHYYENENIDDIINEYFRGLYWNSYYYFDKCVDYKFYFKHHKVPFVSDIYNWILNNEQIVEQMESLYPRFNDYSKLIHPIQQLFMVIPVQSSFLLPSSFKQIMINLPEYFPKNVSQDFQLITKYWQALPEIKILEPFFAWEKIKNIKLTEKEIDRNKFKKPYQISI